MTMMILDIGIKHTITPKNEPGQASRNGIFVKCQGSFPDADIPQVRDFLKCLSISSFRSSPGKSEASP
jgi:hypothetical protein